MTTARPARRRVPVAAANEDGSVNQPLESSISRSRLEWGRSAGLKKSRYRLERARGFGDGVVGRDVRPPRTSRISRATQSKTLSRQEPLPSMLMAIPFSFEDAGERLAGELKAALVAVRKVFGLAVFADGLLESLDAEAGLHRHRHPMRGSARRLNQSTTATRSTEAARHGDIGDVRRPRPRSGPLGRHAPQPIRLDLVAERGFRRIRSAMDAPRISIRFIRVATCRRPIARPSRPRKSRSMPATADRHCRCSSSIRRITPPRLWARPDAACNRPHPRLMFKTFAWRVIGRS